MEYERINGWKVEAAGQRQQKLLHEQMSHYSVKPVPTESAPTYLSPTDVNEDAKPRIFLIERRQQKISLRRHQKSHRWGWWNEDSEASSRISQQNQDAFANAAPKSTTTIEPLHAMTANRALLVSNDAAPCRMQSSLNTTNIATPNSIYRCNPWNPPIEALEQKLHLIRTLTVHMGRTKTQWLRWWISRRWLRAQHVPVLGSWSTTAYSSSL